MTVLEAKYNYGTRVYTTSIGDSLTSIVRKLYNSDNKIGYLVIKTLNCRLDWCSVEPGIPIYYLDMSVLSQISEV